LQASKDLLRALDRIDGRGYKSYRDIKGAYRFEEADGGPFELHIDHVQGDPFAAPSKLRLRVAMQDAALPRELFANEVRKLALADFIARTFRRAIGRRAIGGGDGGGNDGRGAGSGKSGLVFIDAGGQEVLERTAVRIEEGFVEARIEVGLPAAGRRVLSREAERLLCDELPRIAERALFWENLPQPDLRAFVDCVENQEHIRARLEAEGLVAFVGDGAVLPRESGASERPMPKREVVPFVSPASHRVRFEVPNAIEGDSGPRHHIEGMGVRRGITLIVGGGYHGKSTLLRALECGVYPHVPGDGREWVVASPGLVKIRAEDGRSVAGVDIHAFIGDLPRVTKATAAGKKESAPPARRAFSSDDASGSTSQAANIVEAIEAGARGLLLDEDTCATNFMLRDARMQQLVESRHEPITPFVDRVRELYDQQGVSSVLVMGGCGDYFEHADSVLMMRDYTPSDVTAEAKRIAEQNPTGRHPEQRDPLRPATPRTPLANSLDPAKGRREVNISTKSRELILYGQHPLDLRYLEQLVDPSQTRAIAQALHLASQEFMGSATTSEILDALETFLDTQGLDALDPYQRTQSNGHHPGRLARPRRFEIAAALNRLRTLRVR